MPTMKGAGTSIVLKVLLASVIGISLLYATQFILNAEQFYFVSTPSYVILPGMFAVTAIYVTIKEWKNNSKSKIAIMFFAVGAGCWFAGEQLWIIIDVVLDEEPFPSLADVFYIAGYVFFIMFLVLYVRQIKQKITKNLLLFSTIISFVFVLPALYVLGDYYQDEPILSISVALVYPILSSAMLFFVLLGIMFFAKGEHTYFWTLIFVGFLIHTVTDTLFLFTAIDDSYYDGHVSDLLYLIGYLFFIAGAVCYFKTKPNTKTEMTILTFDSIGKIAIPLIIGTVFSVTSVFLVYAYSYAENVTTETFLIMLIITIFIIITVFSASIFIIIKQTDRFIRLRTKEIEMQKKDLEIILEKKAHEIRQASEFSNIGINISQIAHDLRNPLTVLKLNLEMIEKENKENPIISSRLAHMKESINMIYEHMSDVLNYIKKPTLDISEASLLDLIDKSIQNIDSPNTVSIELPKEDVKIQCDPIRMVLVFINILTNAIDAMNNQGVISINTQQKKNATIINFENSGPPIPNDIIDQIFEPLFTTKPNGTGLGLPTCKKIVQQHGGKITISNNPTTVTIELPHKI